MPSEEHYRCLERMFASAPISQWYGAAIDVTEGRTLVTIPVKTEFFHAAQAVHGSVYFRALDDAAFFAVSSTVDDVFILTASFNVYFLRPITSGILRAEGRLVHASSRLYVAESTLTGPDGKALAQGSGTFMKSTMRLAETPGYA